MGLQSLGRLKAPSHWAPPRIELVAGDDAEPIVNLQDAKLAARVLDADEDAMIEGYMLAAQQWAENITHRSITAKQYTMSMSRIPPAGIIDLPLGKVQTVDSITYTDTDGAGQTLATAVYQSDLSSDKGGRIMVASGQSWPSIATDVFNPLVVTFTAGWYPDEAPEPIRQAIKLKIGQFYDARSIEVLPAIDAAMSLLQPWVLPLWQDNA